MNCDSCPIRLNASVIRSNGRNTSDLIRSMGGSEEQAQATIERSELEAKQMESMICQWWWTRSEVDTAGNVRIVECCGRGYLPAFMMNQGNLAMEAAQTLQSTRNAMHEDLEGLKIDLAGGLVRGFEGLGSIWLTSAQIPSHVIPSHVPAEEGVELKRGLNGTTAPALSGQGV